MGVIMRIEITIPTHFLFNQMQKRKKGMEIELNIVVPISLLQFIFYLIKLISFGSFLLYYIPYNLIHNFIRFDIQSSKKSKLVHK